MAFEYPFVARQLKPTETRRMVKFSVAPSHGLTGASVVVTKPLPSLARSSIVPRRKFGAVSQSTELSCTQVNDG